VNLSALGLTNGPAVAAWASTQSKLEEAVPAGSVLLFHGCARSRGGDTAILTEK
jgi:hypothetical protein